MISANGGPNKSRSSNGLDKFRGLLGRDDVVYASVKTSTSGQFFREFDVRKLVGNLPANAGGAATMDTMVISDNAWNLIKMALERIHHRYRLPYAASPDSNDPNQSYEIRRSRDFRTDS